MTNTSLKFVYVCGKGGSDGDYRGAKGPLSSPLGCYYTYQTRIKTKNRITLNYNI